MTSANIKPTKRRLALLFALLFAVASLNIIITAIQPRFSTDKQFFANRMLNDFGWLRADLRYAVSADDAFLIQNVQGLTASHGSFQMTINNTVRRYPVFDAVSRELINYFSRVQNNPKDFIADDENQLASIIISRLTVISATYDVVPIWANPLLYNILTLITVFIIFGCAFAAFVKPAEKLAQIGASFSKGENLPDISELPENELGYAAHVMAGCAADIADLCKFLQNAQGQSQRSHSRNEISATPATALSLADNLMQAREKELAEATAILRRLANGDFAEAFGRGGGPFIAELTEAAAALRGFAQDTNDMLEAAAKGRLNTRLSPDRYNGDWQIMAEGINRLLSDYTSPLNEIADIFEKLGRGRFDIRLEAELPGDLAKLKTQANYALDVLSVCIAEISKITAAIKTGEHDFEILASYPGDLAPIRQSLLATPRIKSNPIKQSSGTLATQAPRISRDASSDKRRVAANQRLSGAFKAVETANNLDKLRAEINRPDYGKY